MNKLRINIIFFVILFIILLNKENVIFASKICINNNTVAEEEKINFYNLTIKDGLTNNRITDIYQDSTGYIWIGTEDGLNQYNGNVVVKYNYENNSKEGLTSACITSINEDIHGNIWVGTDWGLNIINRKEDRITRIEVSEGTEERLSNYIITLIYRDSNDTMWVGTTDGLNRYDEENNQFIKYYLDETDNISANNYITDIAEDDYGHLWISTINKVYTMDLKTFDTYNRENEFCDFEHIYKIDKDNDGSMLVVSEGGIFISPLGKGGFDNYNLEIEENIDKDITEVLCDSRGDIWLSSTSGLIKYMQSNNTTKIYNYANNSASNLLSNSIRCLYEDRSGAIWIGTDKGVSILNSEQQFGNKINNILEKNGIYGCSVTAVLEDSDNDLWIGTNGNGIIYFDINENKMTRFINDESDNNSLISNKIKHITQIKDGEIIISTEKGIITIDKKTGKINRNEEELKKNTLFNQGLKMLIDDQYIWIATTDGLYRFSNETFQVVNYKDHFIEKGIKNYRVVDIFQDEIDENILWLAGGRNGGLIKFHKTEGVIKNYLEGSGNYSLSYGSINCIQGDGKGNLWIGTQSGLCKFNIEDEIFTKYYKKDGLGSDYINSIIIDNNSDIWLGTSNGLSKFIISEDRFINFTEEDGLCGNQFNKRAAYKTHSGQLLFGTTKGIVSFNPDDIEEKVPKEDKVILDTIWINKEMFISDGENIELKYNENNIVIQYFLPDYTRTGSITYLYKMDGVNENWNYSNKDGYAVYTMLKPGKYTFKVKAAKSDGSLTEESSITFVIKEPLWKSTIAYFIYIIIILLLILYICKRVKFLKTLVNKQTKEINRQMEENKKLYEKNIRNEKFKNDYFVNLSHELRTPINIILSVIQLVNSLEKNKELTKEKILYYMNIISKNSKSLLNIINDIIDSSKIESGAYKINKQENVDIVYLVEETALNMREYIENKGIKLVIDPEVEELPICCDPKEIERCIVNLIGNAVKFTEKDGEIKVLIKENNNTVSIIIEDNGIGISKDDQDFIFNRFEQGSNFNSTNVSSSGIGLTLVKCIVELHDGKVNLESELNKGSKFTIILPLNREG